MTDNKSTNDNQNMDKINGEENLIKSEITQGTQDSYANINDIKVETVQSKKQNNGNHFDQKIIVNKNSMETIKDKKDKIINENQNKNSNNSSNKEKEIIKENNKNNDNNTKNNDIIWDTPTGEDPEIEKYYQDLKKEKEKEKNEYKDNNQFNINSHNIINNECNVDDLSLKPSASFSKFKKAPNVILDSGNNSSYMNCVIYCLANCKNIASYYLKELKTYKYHIKDMPLSYYFSRIIFHFYPYPENPLQKSFSLSNFYKILIHLNSTFKGYTEKNIFDFLIYLLDKLHEDDQKIRNNKINSDNDNQKTFDIKKRKDYINYIRENEVSCILDNFCWVNQKIQKCLECSSEDISYQKFFTYDLDIENIYNLKSENDFNNIEKITILDCIKRKIHNPIKKEKYCINCQKKTLFEFNSLIDVSPQYFIFLLKLNDNLMNDILYKIKIEEEFNLSDYVKDKSSDNKYVIQEIIFYDFDNKKYLAHCCNPIDKKWYYYKKDSISLQEMKKVFSYKLYKLFPIILFYKQD